MIKRIVICLTILISLQVGLSYVSAQTVASPTVANPFSSTSGGASGLTVGTTVITGGADRQCLFDDGGFIGENSGCTFNKGSGKMIVTLHTISGNGSAAAPALSIGTPATAQWGFYSDGSSRACMGKNNIFGGCIESSTTTNGLAWRSDSFIGFLNGTTEGAGFDTLLGRFGSGVFKVSSNASNIKYLMGGGAAVASAAALPLPTGNVFHVTGTTNITSITATNFASGIEITLIFDGILTVVNGNNIKIGTDFATTADDVLKLAYDGTNFYEISRKVN